MTSSLSLSSQELYAEIKRWNLITPIPEAFDRAGRSEPKIREEMSPRWQVEGEIDGEQIQCRPKKSGLLHYFSVRSPIEQDLGVVYEKMLQTLKRCPQNELYHALGENDRWMRNLHKLDVNVTSHTDQYLESAGIRKKMARKVAELEPVRGRVIERSKELTKYIRKLIHHSHEVHHPYVEQQETVHSVAKPAAKEKPSKTARETSKETKRPRRTTKKIPLNAAQAPTANAAVDNDTLSMQIFSLPQASDLRPLLVSTINKANKSITLFMYSLTDPRLQEALEAKAKSGVKVTLLHDKDAFKYAHGPIDPAITMKKIDCQGLMHLKVLAIDEEEVVFGSANFTTESVTKDRNLVTTLKSKEFAQYVNKKADMILHPEKYPHESASSCQKFVLDGGRTLDFSFLPFDKDVEKKLANLIDSAKTSIEAAIFTFTHKDIAQKLIDKHKAGVKIKIVIDGKQANGAGKAICQELRDAGIDVIIAVPNAFQLIHHKYVRIDRKVVAHGSANWTEAAFRKNWDCLGRFENLTEQDHKILDDMWGIFVAAVEKQVADKKTKTEAKATEN